MSEIVLRSLYFHAARLSALEAAIRSSRTICADAHALDSLDPADLIQLANALVEKCVRTGDTAALHKSFSLLYSAAAFSAKELDVDILNGLGHALRVRCEHYSDWSDLDEAVRLHRTALAGDSYDVGSRMLLARALLMRYVHAQRDEDGQEVVDLLRTAPLNSMNLAQRSTVSTLLAEAIQSHMGPSGSGPKERDQWDEALLLARQGVESRVSLDSLSTVESLTTLGVVLKRRGQRLALTEEVVEAGAVLQEAVAIAQTIRHPAGADALIEQCYTLQHLFASKKNDPRLLDEAEQLALQALNSYPPQHYAHDSALAALEGVRTTRLDDIGGKRHEYEQLIETKRRRLARFGPGHPKRSTRVYDLAGKLLVYYRTSDDLRHLDEAATLYQEILTSLPKEADIWPYASLSYAQTLIFREEKARQVDHVDKAIFFLTVNINLLPPGHLMLSWNSHLLGVAYRLRYLQTFDEDDLNTAFLMASDAHTNTSESWRIETCDGLANCLKDRFFLRQDGTDLNSAIMLRQEMLDSGKIGQNHPSRSEFSRNLAQDYLTRRAISNHDSDFTSSMNAFADAVGTWDGYGGARDCLAFALQWIAAADKIGDAAIVSLAYEKALDLLPRLANLGLELQTRLKALSQGAGLACDAALHALSQKAPSTAVELLEQGRGVFWQQSLRLRIPLSGAPGELGEKYALLSRQLDTDDAETAENHSGQTAAERRKLVDAFEELVSALQKVPGLAGSFRSKTFEELRAGAANGPVVVLLANAKACEAVLITYSDPQPRRLALAKVTMQNVQRMASAITTENALTRAATGGAFAARQERLKVNVRRQAKSQSFDDILSLLWTAFVLPIFQALDLAKSGPRTRLFWIPTGLLTFLPFHAAGIYTGSDQACVSDYVISSYAPTISALLHAQRAARDLPEHVGSEVLLVAEPSAHGEVPLPHALEELEEIQKVVSDERLFSIMEHPSVDAVMTQIADCSVLHLACHGKAERKDPLRSGFLLGADTLTVRALMRLKLTKARFAFLSACQSALGDEIRPDEAVHLASAMLFVGFPSVVGTMWTMNDADGPAVAREVYSQIFAGGKTDYSAVPYALDAAMRKLRSSGVSPSRWATYIHLGA